MQIPHFQTTWQKVDDSNENKTKNIHKFDQSVLVKNGKIYFIKEKKTYIFWQSETFQHLEGWEGICVDLHWKFTFPQVK